MISVIPNTEINMNIKKHIYMPMNKLLLIIVTLLIGQSSYADSICEECWVPKLEFDIEGMGTISTMIFISGHSYSLSETNRILNEQGKENFFCKNGNVSSNELIAILNKSLKGVVTSEQVTAEISNGLKSKYPCE